jgi:hypothetical protein
MSELEQKISKLLQEEQPITESEAQDLAYQICELPEIKGGRVEAEVIVKTAEEWINVKEKLPEIGTEVIVYCPKCTVRKVTALARFIRYEEATDYYWDNDYGGSNIHVMDSVTHWKPMPNKPKQ